MTCKTKVKTKRSKKKIQNSKILPFEKGKVDEGYAVK